MTAFSSLSRLNAGPSVEAGRPHTLVPKTRAELLEQLDRISTIACSGESIAPRTLKAGLVESSIADFKRDHPIRYDIYREALRQEAKGAEAKPIAPELLERLKELNRLDDYIERHQTGLDQTLRPKQMEVFKALRASIERGDRSGYIKLPTGSGKTVIFSEFVEALGGRSLVVVPTNQLVEQTVERLKQFAGQMKVSSYDKDNKDLSGQVVVTTYDSLLNMYDEGLITPSDFSTLILDEAHRALGPRRHEILSAFQSECLTVGFTATPEFNEEKSLRRLVGEAIYEMSLKEAVEGGMLCPTRWIPVQTKADLSNVKILSSGEYDEKSLERAVNTEAINKAAAQVFDKYFSSRTGVAFCVNIDHAKDAAKEFNKQGIPADATWGGDPDLDAKLEKLKRGEIRMLCNAKLLIEGFDQDGISVCLNLAPTRSIVNAEQRGGRVLRLCESTPFKQAFVIDFIPESTPAERMPVTFAEVMGSVALGTIAPLPFDPQENGGAREPLPEIEGVQVLLGDLEIAAFLDRKGVFLGGSAPEGWIPIRDLHEHFKEVTPGLIPVLARELAYRDPEGLIQHFKTPGELGNITEHVSPELVAELRESLEAMPEGWSLLREVSIPGLGEKSTVALFEEIATEKPFSKQLSFLAGKIRIVSPTLIAEAHSRAREMIDLPPDGWVSKPALMAQYPALKWTELRFLIKGIIGKELGLSGTFDDPIREKKTDYYAPVVAELLPEAIAGYQHAREIPQGWLSSKVASNELGLGRGKLIDLAVAHGKEGVDYVRLPFSGNFSYYYAPHLLVKIVAEVKKAEELKKPAPLPKELVEFKLEQFPEVKGAKRTQLMERLKKEFPEKAIEVDQRKKSVIVSRDIFASVKDSFLLEQYLLNDFKIWEEVRGRHPGASEYTDGRLAALRVESPGALKEIPYRGRRLLLIEGNIARDIYTRAKAEEERLRYVRKA